MSKILLKCRSYIMITIVLAIAFALSGCSGNKYAVKKADKPQYPVETVEPRELGTDKIPAMTGRDFEALGDRYFRRQELAMAFVQYEKSLVLEPQNLQVLYKKGLLYIYAGMHAEARDFFSDLAEENPDSALPLEGLGRVFFQMQEYGKAEKHLKAAAEIDPDLWTAYYYLGLTYASREEHLKAVKSYSAAVRTRPEKGALYNSLGLSYLALGRNKKAARSFDKACRAKDARKAFFNNYGFALAHLGKYHEALDAFKGAGRPEQAYNNLGVVFLEQGRAENAVQCFEKAIELSPVFYFKATRNLEEARMLVENRSGD